MSGWATSSLILLLTAALGIFNLAKDWEKHGNNKRRFAVLFLIVAICALGVFNLYWTDNQARRDKNAAVEHQKQSDDTILRLQQAVDSSQKAQEINNRTFLEQLGKLYTKAESERLRAEIKGYEERILKQVKPEPMARIVASFDTTADHIPMIEETANIDKKDGTVAVDAMAIDVADAPAKSGECLMRFCDLCTFASEPPQSNRPAGALPTDRSRPFQLIVPHTAISLACRVLPPRNIRRFAVDITCGCENCSNSRPTGCGSLLIGSCASPLSQPSSTAARASPAVALRHRQRAPTTARNRSAWRSQPTRLPMRRQFREPA